MLNVLVACEESQAVCIEFRKLGHRAFSCDIQECSGGRPEWHIKGDVLPLLNGKCEFKTEDGHTHTRTDRWDLIIAHPPCTRLYNSGQRWCSWGTEEYKTQKIKEREDAVEFFMKFANADCDSIAIENPTGIMSSRFRKPDCIYNPYDFKGETECKKTCLWLKGLPPLKGTRNITLPKEERTQNIWKAVFDGKQYRWSDPLVAKLRSKTPTGVAEAMATQWSNYLERSD